MAGVTKGETVEVPVYEFGVAKQIAEESLCGWTASVIQQIKDLNLDYTIEVKEMVNKPGLHFNGSPDLLQAIECVQRFLGGRPLRNMNRAKGN